MRKLMMLGALAGGVAWLGRRRRQGPLDLAHTDPDHSHEKVEQMEERADIPGGVRP